MTKSKTWTVGLGGYKNAQALLRALVEAGVTRIGLAESLLHGKDFDVQKEQRQVDLVVRTVEQLGFTKSETYEKICVRAEKRGFELCPPDLGPLLTLEPSSRFSADVLYIGMEPIADIDGGGGLRAIFGIVLVDGKVVLKGFYCAPRYIFGLQTQFVLLKPCVVKRERPKLEELVTRF